MIEVRSSIGLLSVVTGSCLLSIVFVYSLFTLFLSLVIGVYEWSLVLVFGSVGLGLWQLSVFSSCLS